MAIAAVAAIVTWLATTPAGASAELDMRVLDGEVRWPYLESFIKAQGGYLEVVTLEEITSVTGVELDETTAITATLPTGGASFTLQATAPSEDEAVEAVKAAGDWLIERNLEARTFDLRAKADTLEAYQADLEAGIGEMEAALEAASAESATAVRVEEELRQAVQISAETSAEIVDLRTEERHMISPIVPVGRARALEEIQRQGATAAATGSGALLLALASTGRLRRR